jgi:hypothetical protein
LSVKDEFLEELDEERELLVFKEMENDEPFFVGRVEFVELENL